MVLFLLATGIAEPTFLLSHSETGVFFFLEANSRFTIQVSLVRNKSLCLLLRLHISFDIVSLYSRFALKFSAEFLFVVESTYVVDLRYQFI